jgi:hypothetical protein
VLLSVSLTIEEGADGHVAAATGHAVTGVLELGKLATNKKRRKDRTLRRGF